MGSSWYYFTFENTALIITALVGSSHDPVIYHVQGMNRSFFNVILGGWGNQSSSDKSKEQKPVKWKCMMQLF